MSNAWAVIGPTLNGDTIYVYAPVPGTAGNGIPVFFETGTGAWFVSDHSISGGPYSLNIHTGDGTGGWPTALDIVIAIGGTVTPDGYYWSAGYSGPDGIVTNDDTSLIGTYYMSGGTDDIRTGAGSSAGSSTVSGVGAATSRGAGASAGTTPSAAAYAGVFGTSAGTSTAAAVGAATLGSRGAADGTTPFVIGITGLRQATGVAAGTSGAAQTIKAANARTDVDHVAAALNRLCEVFKEAATL